MSDRKLVAYEEARLPNGPYWRLKIDRSAAGAPALLFTIEHACFDEMYSMLCADSALAEHTPSGVGAVLDALVALGWSPHPVPSDAEIVREAFNDALESVPHPAPPGHEHGGAYARAGALAAGDPDWMNAAGGEAAPPTAPLSKWAWQASVRYFIWRLTGHIRTNETRRFERRKAGQR